MPGKTIIHQASSRSVGSEYSYSSGSTGSSSRTPSPGDYRGSGRDYLTSVRSGSSSVVINHGSRHYEPNVGSPDYRTSQAYHR